MFCTAPASALGPSTVQVRAAAVILDGRSDGINTAKETLTIIAVVTRACLHRRKDHFVLVL